MAISIFETRTMITALEEMKPVRTFLKDTFFGNVRTFDTEHVDVDVIKGKRRMAPFVHPRREGQLVDRIGYRTDTYKAPMIKPKMETRAEHLMKRMAGESLYSGVSPMERAAELLGRDMRELDEIITRREEWMCAQAIFSGRIHIVGDGVDEVIDFDLTNRETLAGGALWTAADTSDPLVDLRRWRLEVVKASGINPDICVMSSDVAAVFADQPRMRDRMDLRRVDIGQIDPRQLPNGATYHGYLKELGLDIYSYDEWFLDDSDEEKPMVPEKTLLVGSTGARTDLLYGAIVDLDAGQAYDLPRVPKTWTEKDPSTRILQILSRPLPVPVQVDAFFVAAPI